MRRPLRRLDGRDPVLPARTHLDITQRPRGLSRRAVGADLAHARRSSGAARLRRATTATATRHDCLSVDISDWDTPGILYGKTAKQCTHDEIAREVWAQITARLNDVGEPVLRDDDLVHSWFLDPAIRWHAATRTQHQRRRRCWSTRPARGRTGRSRARRSPTCSSPATTSADGHRPGDDGRRERVRARRRLGPARRLGIHGAAARHAPPARTAGTRAVPSRRCGPLSRRAAAHPRGVTEAPGQGPDAATWGRTRVRTLSLSVPTRTGRADPCAGSCPPPTSAPRR